MNKTKVKKGTAVLLFGYFAAHGLLSGWPMPPGCTHASDAVQSLCKALVDIALTRLIAALLMSCLLCCHYFEVFEGRWVVTAIVAQATHCDSVLGCVVLGCCEHC
jgi:hypothetical protein